MSVSGPPYVKLAEKHGTGAGRSTVAARQLSTPPLLPSAVARLVIAEGRQFLVIFPPSLVAADTLPVGKPLNNTGPPAAAPRA